MKRILLLALLGLFCSTFLYQTHAQIIFSEDFDGISGPTAGGAGTYSFPQGWLLRNVDNRTPDANVAYVNQAWERREDFSHNVADSAAFSTSWYVPAGVAEDWMWTPEITLPATGNSLLQWNAVAYDPAYRDGYEVRIMVSPNVPTGGTGVIGNQLTNSTLLFSTTSENSNWTAREVNLSSYNGQTFRIAFRNNSNDKFLLLIDDVIIKQVNDFDLYLTEYSPFEYTKIPLSQVHDIPLGAKVMNLGILPAQNFNLKANIHNSNNQLVETIYSENIVSLAPSQITEPVFPKWNPAEVGVYTVTYETNSTETDPTPENNSLITSMDITNDVYARDNGEAVGSLGIGAGNGYLGQSFTINEETYAESGTITFTRGYAGRDYKLALWNTDESGEPNIIIAETELKTYINDDGFTDTLSFENGPQILIPGRYVLTAVEIDSTLAVAQTSKQFTPGTTFVDWTTNPISGWGNNEDYGASFQKTYAIRLNLGKGIEPDENNILYVDKNVTGGDETGDSWENAIPELADALKWAKENESEWTTAEPLKIWVAEGTYKPMYSPADNNFGNPDGRNNIFLMVENVQLYGGFEGNETTLDARDWNVNETILSGEQQDDGDAENNSYHVVITAGDLGTAFIDGFTIQDGKTINDVGNNQITVNGIVFQNRAAGGIYAESEEILVRNSIIRNNIGYGATALGNYGGDVTLINCLIYGNESHTGGGQATIYGETVKLINTTITKNMGYCMVTFFEAWISQNSIVHGNIGVTLPIYNENGNYIFENSILEGVEPSAEVMNEDPMFTDVANNDFSLQANSPAIEAGDNSLFVDLDENTLDLAGNLRLFGANIDIGAYEYQNVVISPDVNNILYVNKNVSGGYQSGNSWENAIPELADALKWAKENESEWNSAEPLKIWVAEGTYKPMYSPEDGNFGNPDGRRNTFLMVENVKLYGGFEGNETTLEARDWNVNETILSGDIDNTPGDNSGNATHVVLSANNVDSSSMDGFIITGGNADLNEVISVNSLSIYGGHGGGIYNYDTSFSIANTIVTDNSSSSNGGGIYNYNASVSMNNLTISNNTSVIGGGIYNNLSSQSITNSNISNNTSVTGAEGGIYNRFNTLSITNTIISENAGNGIVNVSSSLTIVNSTVTNNIGIGIYNESTSPKIYNSIIYGNGNNQSNVFNNNNSLPDIQNSLIGGIDENNEFGNINADPLFTDAANGDFSLQVCSPAVNSGNNSLFDGLDENTLDIAGNPRLFGVNIDMGAYEFQDEQIDYSLVSFEDITETYDGDEHSIEVENLPEGTTVAYEITNENNTTTTGNSAIDAGIYEITATISGCGQPQAFNATLTIEKADAIITADATQTHTYDGNMHIVSASLNHVETAMTYTPQQGFTNAGTYEITVSAAETTNYNSTSKVVTLIIENDDWDTGGGSGVTLPNETYTYNGTAQSVEVENLPQDANATYTITDSEENTESGNSAINAGVYTVTAYLTRPNYDDLELTATLTINKAEAIITANDVQTHTYDGTVKNTVASLNHSETTLVYTPQQGYTDVGTYAITISAVETQNYLAASKTIDLVIENADFDGIEFEDGEFTYDGIAHSIFVSGAPNDATVTYTNNGQINAGTYTVTALIQMPNYNDLTLTADLIINKAEAIITANDVQTHTYDGTVKNTVASLNHSETTLVYAPQQGYTDAGTYAITISAVETQNYLAVSKTIDLVIENADFEGIEFNDGEFTYDGIAHSIFVSGEPENATVNYTGNGQTNAGTYTVSALIQIPNYNDLTLTADLIINKAEAIITANDLQTHVYDGTVKNVVASLNHSETTLIYTPQQGYTDAGTYAITISAVETQNYLAVSKTIDLIIENADFDGIEFEDGEFIYDGIAHSIFVSGAPNDATVTYTNNGQINAGTYTVTALIQMPNYNDLTLTAELIINKASAIITSNDVQTHTYDGTVKNVVASLNHSETTLIYTPQQGYTDAGTYAITISAVETQNYLAVSKTIDLIIENADFDGIEFEDGEFTYDGMTHSIFVSGEPENATVTYTNNSQTNAGTYTVSALIQMPNYNDLTLTAELIINKATAIITANEVQTHIYDGTVKNTVASLNHSETILVYTPQQGYTDAGTYAITISAVETQNYLAASKTIDLIIENADFDGIEFEDGEFTYDGIAHSIFVSGEPENATVNYTGNGQTNAGTYTVSALIQIPNYNDLTLTAELTINKANQTLTFNPIPVKNLENDVDFQLDASASSGLDVYYTFTFDTENPAATVTPSGWVELLTSGSIWITAHQDGNENYLPAVSVERELEIVSSNNSIISINIHGDIIENPGNEIYYLIDCGDTSNSINIEIETETGATVIPGHTFTMDIPAPGIYRQIISVTSQNGSVRTYELIIEKRFNFNDIVVQKFDNVLLVNNNPDNNGGYEFDAYEWYKNGALIGTGQYYSAGDNSNDSLDPNAVYHVRMRTTDGEWLSTCESGIELRNAYSVKIAPNPVYSGNIIKVFADFPEDEMKNMSIKLFSMAGELILETRSSERITEIRLPAGMTSASYIIQVNTGKTIKNIQFLVK